MAETKNMEKNVETLQGEVVLDGPLIVKLSKEYDFEGEKVREIDLTGLEDVTAKTMMKANKILARTGGGNGDDEDFDSNIAVENSGSTKIITGGLESSGTDLSEEITNLILIQRGYQANTRIVTVTDTMLEELINMKR